VDTMVLLVGDLCWGEDDDCACSHDLTAILKQVYLDGQWLHMGGDSLKTVSVNFQFHLLAHLVGESVRGSIL
jgi:hypothetical protein